MEEGIYKLQRTMMMDGGEEVIMMTDEEGTIDETLHMEEAAVSYLFEGGSVLFIRGKLSPEAGLVISELLTDQNW